MTLFVHLVLFALGLTILSLGAELFVRGTSRFALHIGVSKLVIGLTVVSFATSSPEFVVSVLSSVSGKTGLCLGNVVGSNIANILLILGLCSVIAPLVVQKKVTQRDVPVVIATSFAIFLLFTQKRIGWIVGFVLLLCLVAYTVLLVWFACRENPEEGKTEKRGSTSLVMDWVMILLGFVFLLIGGSWVVDHAVGMASSFGISEVVIGLTLVSVGTSLPELATSVVGVLKGEVEIAVGNVVGSCIFNLLGVLGVSAVVAPEGIQAAPGVLEFDFPFLIAASFACLPIFFTGHRISRWEGGGFLCYYFAYLTFLAMQSKERTLEGYGVMWLLCSSLILISFGVGFFRIIRDKGWRKFF